ncbi:DUF952 domain-containing protein [Ferrovibrio terrae]|uniref:DUF952 domain-containing protein n=1 Tax=Ferrovibrio terrae TaxID=2594003 RepID=UPI003137EDFE
MTVIYRIISETDWAAAQAAGAFSGTAHDLRDGFIHFSTAKQAAETAARHYAGKTDLLLLFVRDDDLMSPLKWEKSRNDDLFPHLYGVLPVTAVYRVETLPLDSATGRHIFPGDMA